jgi:hypothetical protein
MVSTKPNTTTVNAETAERPTRVVHGPTSERNSPFSVDARAQSGNFASTCRSNSAACCVKYCV